MTVSVSFVDEAISFTLYGYSKIHEAGTPYSADVQELMGKLWMEIRTNGLAHRGINHMVYESGGRVFAGVELEPVSAESGEHGLESFHLNMPQYLHGKHIGPYDRLGETYNVMRARLTAQGKTEALPLVEVYGHWSDDPAKLETDIYMSYK
ncbi:GyrI-like domain-containing protein [Paenibacillus silvisoli]|uniref:GyrI-like domain-containing protein n=1 Tax=Paenibacillus silvisoli TaxID=3110539 RepID=UPI002805FE1E|nr:GyrI-like domain-containing protein [Paenibacillus silvisoli]